MRLLALVMSSLLCAGCEVEENRAHANRVMEKYVAVDSEPLSDREKFEKKMKILRERM